MKKLLITLMLYLSLT